jgi:NAD(P)-dependent dehydrogenase (short-subunit alcohol dehydrogenase family)
MNSVEGKVAFITGGASGIGLGMARVFSRAGMKVVIGDIRDEQLDKAAAELDAMGLAVHGVRVDVADRASVAAAADEVERLHGRVDILCNNAGVNLFAPMDECSYADWDWVLGVNLGGVVNGIQEFLPRIKRHGEGGHIVNTASMASFITGPGAGIYATTKFAVRGLSESLRWNLAPQRIGVSCLCPGLVKSAIYESENIRPEGLAGGAATDQAFMARLPEIHQLGMEPDEVAEKTLKGILANDLYIFPHPEFKEELREIFDSVLAAIPEGEVDPRRLAFEEGRRARMRAAQ